MRRSKEEAAESRDRILAAAARLFRERGPEGVSVADIMQAAGMTHGGFYKHFASKDALLAEAIGRMFAEKRALLAGDTPAAAAAALADYARTYLSPFHVTELGSGCPIAGLALDAARAGPPATEAVAAGTAAVIADIAHAHGDGGEEAALRDLIVMVGSLVLARAVRDPALRDRILATGRKARS